MILLSRVVTRLGSVAQVNPKVIEDLFATDLAYLQGLYNRVNALDEAAGACPHCGKAVHGAAAEMPPGEGRGVWSATPPLN